VHSEKVNTDNKYPLPPNMDLCRKAKSIITNVHSGNKQRLKSITSSHKKGIKPTNLRCSRAFFGKK